MKHVKFLVAATLLFALHGCGINALVAAYNDPAAEYRSTCYITSGMGTSPTATWSSGSMLSI